jgi:hypothetical protein
MQTVWSLRRVQPQIRSRTRQPRARPKRLSMAGGSKSIKFGPTIDTRVIDCSPPHALCPCQYAHCSISQSLRQNIRLLINGTLVNDNTRPLVQFFSPTLSGVKCQMKCDSHVPEGPTRATGPLNGPGGGRADMGASVAYTPRL